MCFQHIFEKGWKSFKSSHASGASYRIRPHARIKKDLRKDIKNLLITIKDSGIGIPKEKKSEIFKRFSRLENAKDIRPDGSGIGLYLSKAVVDAHGGEIWFESELNSGTTFYINLYKHLSDSNLKNEKNNERDDKK